MQINISSETQKTKEIAGAFMEDWEKRVINANKSNVNNINFYRLSLLAMGLRYHQVVL